MDKTPRFWQVCASLTFTTSDGWTSTRSVPTFALISCVQGILNKTSAERVARSIILTSVENVTDLSVSVSVLPFD